MRLGDELRMRESLPGIDRPPPEIANLLQWMARSVEAWCVASECATDEPRFVAEPVPTAAMPVPVPSSGHVGGGIGDAVARVRKDGWGPIIPPLKRGE